MTPKAARRLRILAGAAGVLLVLGVLMAGWYYQRVHASLPQLDGLATVGGLSGTVTIERDGQGVPTIRGTDRVDVARALGWLHAQDRFFHFRMLRLGR